MTFRNVTCYYCKNNIPNTLTSAYCSKYLPVTYQPVTALILWHWPTCFLIILIITTLVRRLLGFIFADRFRSTCMCVCPQICSNFHTYTIRQKLTLKQWILTSDRGGQRCNIKKINLLVWNSDLKLKFDSELNYFRYLYYWNNNFVFGYIKYCGTYLRVNYSFTRRMILWCSPQVRRRESYLRLP